MEPTAVNSLIETLLPFIDRSRVSDTMLHAITEIHIAMEKEQSECICVNVIEIILDESEQGKEINSKQIFEEYYNKTFKSE